MKAISELRTDVGRVRKLNEDSVYIERDESLLAKRGELLVVADGMGGHQSGEVASQQAIESIKQAYYTEEFNHPGKTLKKAIEEANRAIFARAQKENRIGMGTTVVAAVRLNDLLYVAHVGDSRLYLIRTGQIKPMTEDHSLVAEQVAAGILTPEQARHHPYRNIISRAVGTSPEVEVELATRPLKLKDGDIAILCSDGLTEHLSDEEILQIVQGRTPAAANEALVAAANNAGGRDNISVIMTLVGRSDTLKKITNEESVVVDDETEPVIYQNLFTESSKENDKNSSSNRSVRFLGGLLAIWAIMFLSLTGGWLLWQRELLVFTPNAPAFSIGDSVEWLDQSPSILNENQTHPITTVTNTYLPILIPYPRLSTTDPFSVTTKEREEFDKIPDKRTKGP